MRYDPETSRFISPDDVGVLDETFTQLNGLNLYAYCYNNPVMMTDPDGAFALTWWQKLLIGLAFITLGAIATALSGGSFAAAFVCGLAPTSFRREYFVAALLVPPQAVGRTAGWFPHQKPNKKEPEGSFLLGTPAGNRTRNGPLGVAAFVSKLRK